MNPTPLVIDLDGTLLKSDLLIESSLTLLRESPIKIFNLFTWLLSGKYYLKDSIAQSTTIEVEHLPYNHAVIDFIREKKSQGTSIVLATASHHIYANQIAQHLQLFDKVIATENNINLSAHHKRDRLIAEYGEGGFDYMGNSSDDLPIWQVARHTYVVNPLLGVEKKAQSVSEVKKVFKEKNKLKAWIKALRLHQWVKNLLVFVPLLASLQWTQMHLWFNGFWAFIVFSLCASSVYLLNDLVDLNDDRQHKEKRYRPFASGELSVRDGLIAIPILLIFSFVGSILILPPLFTLTLATYYILTLAYSLSFKRRMVVDVITLASLYTLRIVAGAFALPTALTFWMLAFSMFIFLSLALVKRYAELLDAKKMGKIEKTSGRGYYPSDLEMIASLGASAGYLSVMVLALYIQDEATINLYHHPEFIWLACPLLLFWISRIWLIAHRGNMNADPVVFAVNDNISRWVGILFIFIFWVAM